MKRFPRSVREAMSRAGAAATCLPVRLDRGDWETAVFFQVSGPECKEDRRRLRRADGPLPVGIETDLIESSHAAVIQLRLEVHTLPEDPLAGEILLTPGHASEHFDALKLLTRQPRLCWFFGDQAYWLVHSQAHPLDSEQHRGFEQLLGDALRHDALIRMTGRYDAQAALSEVVVHYELRAGAARAQSTGESMN